MTKNGRRDGAAGESESERRAAGSGDIVVIGPAERTGKKKDSGDGEVNPDIGTGRRERTRERGLARGLSRGGVRGLANRDVDTKILSSQPTIFPHFGQPRKTKHQGNRQFSLKSLNFRH